MAKANEAVWLLEYATPDDIKETAWPQIKSYAKFSLCLSLDGAVGDMWSELRLRNFCGIAMAGKKIKRVCQKIAYLRGIKLAGCRFDPDTDLSMTEVLNSIQLGMREGDAYSTYVRFGSVFAKFEKYGDYE